MRSTYWKSKDLKWKNEVDLQIRIIRIVHNIRQAPPQNSNSQLSVTNFNKLKISVNVVKNRDQMIAEAKNEIRQPNNIS